MEERVFVLVLALLNLAIGIIGPVIAYAIDWPSAAVTEAYAIILINSWLLLMQRVHGEK